MVAHVLKITLRHVQPAVWRRVRIPGDATLGELHDVLQITLGWTDSHLHAFQVGKREYGVPDGEDASTLDEEEITLDEIARNHKKLVYLYDFGDGWEHDVAIEKTVKDPTALECLDGGRAVPPEDCGGPGGYEDLLAILANRKHPEHDERKEWVGDFDPERFDVEAVNEVLFEYVGSHAAMSDPAEVDALMLTLDEALDKDAEAMVTVRARVVMALIRDLISRAIDLDAPE